jgi:hypothetical protein
LGSKAIDSRPRSPSVATMPLMSRNWDVVPSWITSIVPPRSTTNSRGSPGGEVTKIGALKVPTGCSEIAAA